MLGHHSWPPLIGPLLGSYQQRRQQLQGLGQQLELTRTHRMGNSERVFHDLPPKRISSEER